MPEGRSGAEGGTDDVRPRAGAGAGGAIDARRMGASSSRRNGTVGEANGMVRSSSSST
jgi:hypothetical protein